MQIDIIILFCNYKLKFFAKLIEWKYCNKAGFELKYLHL